MIIYILISSLLITIVILSLVVGRLYNKNKKYKQFIKEVKDTLTPKNNDEVYYSDIKKYSSIIKLYNKFRGSNIDEK